MQLDLFTHGRDVMLQNDVIAALRARDVASGRQALERFRAEFCDHETIGPLGALLDALACPATRAADRDAIAIRVREIETLVTPAAVRIFGQGEATKWLSPVWSSLAGAAVGLAFQPDSPQVHAGILYLRARDFASAETQIAKITAWRRIPVPLSWMAEARFHRSGLEAVWCLLAELAWMDCALFRDAAQRLQSSALHRLLSEFETGLPDEGDLDFSWFPAWLLIRAPEVVAVLRQAHAGNGKPPERVARLIIELLLLEKQGRHADLVAQRRRLQYLHPGLCRYYMASR